MRGVSPALLVSSVGVCAVPALPAQTPAPSFETASVKPNASGPGAPMAVRPQNDRLTIVNVPGRQLVQMAFRVEEQLGLKLEPRRIPLDVIVIEHVERPVPD